MRLYIVLFFTKMTAPDREKFYFDYIVADPLADYYVKASKSSSYDQPILEKGSDWEMAVVRFSCPVNGIPLFNFQVQRGPLQTDRDLGTYSVTLVRGGITSQIYLTYANRNLSAVPLPAPPSQNPPLYIQDQNTDYYGVFTVQHMLDMFNTAFVTAHAALPVIPGSQPPQLIYDPATGIITLVAQIANYDVDVVGHTEIYVNQFSFRFFQSMPTLRHGFNLPDGKDYEFVVANQYNNISGSDYLIKQGNATLSDWNDLTSIVISIPTLPTRPEYTPNGGGLETLVSAAPSQIITTDFIPSPAENLNQRGTILYTPSAEYRWMNIVSDTQVRTFAVRVMWTDRYLNTRVISFRPDEQVTIKFLFQKKREAKFK